MKVAITFKLAEKLKEEFKKNVELNNTTLEKELNDSLMKYLAEYKKNENVSQDKILMNIRIDSDLKEEMESICRVEDNINKTFILIESIKKYLEEYKNL